MKIMFVSATVQIFTQVMYSEVKEYLSIPAKLYAVV